MHHANNDAVCICLPWSMTNVVNVTISCLQNLMWPTPVIFRTMDDIRWSKSCNKIQAVWILNQHVEIMHGIPRQCGASTRAIFMPRTLTFHFHFRLLLSMLVIPLSMLALLPLSHSLSTVSPACAHCQPPTFPPGGRVLYLPHCVNGKSLNYCDAVCTGEKVVKIALVILNEIEHSKNQLRTAQS